jgi:hypothetical protein
MATSERRKAKGEERKRSQDSYEQDTLNAFNAYGTATLSNVSRIVTHTYSANAPTGLRNLASSEPHFQRQAGRSRRL